MVQVCRTQQFDILILLFPTWNRTESAGLGFSLSTPHLAIRSPLRLLPTLILCFLDFFALFPAAFFLRISRHETKQKLLSWWFLCDWAISRDINSPSPYFDFQNKSALTLVNLSTKVTAAKVLQGCFARDGAVSLGPLSITDSTRCEGRIGVLFVIIFCVPWHAT